MDYRTFIPELSDESVAQLGKLKALYTEWNAAINVISRKDMDAPRRSKQDEAQVP